MVPGLLTLGAVLSGTILRERLPSPKTRLAANTLGPVGSGKLVFLTDIFADLRFLLKSINAFETRLSHFFAHVLHFFPEPLIIKVIQEKIWFIRKYFKIVWMAQYMWLLDMGLKKTKQNKTLCFFLRTNQELGLDITCAILK